VTGLIMFAAALILLVVGYPVAFTFGAVAMFFGAIAAFLNIVPDHWTILHFFSGWSMADFTDEFLSMFAMMPFRIYSIMTNKILMAVPLFIYMGIVLQKSDLATRLLESMGVLFGKVSKTWLFKEVKYRHNMCSRNIGADNTSFNSSYCFR